MKVPRRPGVVPGHVIAFITEEPVVEKILRHLDRWDPPADLLARERHPERTVVYDKDVPTFEEIDELP